MVKKAPQHHPFDENEKNYRGLYLKWWSSFHLWFGNLMISLKKGLSDLKFYEDYFKAQYISDAAGGTSGVYSVEGVPNSLFDGYSFSFDNGENGNYNVDWPDGIKPIGKRS